MTISNTSPEAPKDQLDLGSMNKPKEIFLKDYQKPNFLIESVDLDFNIEPLKTKVQSKLKIKRNGAHKESLFLDGVGLKPLGFKLNGEVLGDAHYELLPDGIEIKTELDDFIFESIVEIDPKNNLSCEGLYQSGEIFCTQNEAEGFRKITYFMDRPDVMACFTTTVRADKNVFPTLLANGNKLEDGIDENGKNYVVWKDPYPKPCYLFALVAGDLACVRDTYTTMSGKHVELEIYVDHGNEDKCDHAMNSLKNSMKWDEEKFGLEYDLDIYMIVAVDSFNMGAMENKGLNIFNSAYVLAKRETATDDNFQGIESVIGHEYFHNWTGNRVTCRDWFQLTLKEGLTVFRDQEFSADMLSRPVKRIDDVVRLRRHQFPEDQGPMSHPIQPKSYIEINNFYTATVYEKGAEVIRMIHTLLGEQGFRKGMDLYFKRHDGQAVTTADFVDAMASANGFNLDQFKMWYNQSGTPKLKVSQSYDSEKKTLSLSFEQEARIHSDDFDALHMPMHIGMFLKSGEELNLGDKLKLELKEKKSVFIFDNIPEEPVISINRGFSAPVIIDREIASSDLSLLMANESDEFARYEAAQNLYKKELELMIAAAESGGVAAASEGFFKSYEALLKDDSLERAYLAYALALPSEAELDEESEVYRIDAVHTARKEFKKQIAMRFEQRFLELYRGLEQKEFSLSASSMGERALREVCLNYLCCLESDSAFELAKKQYENASNMTEEFSSLSFLAQNFHKKSENFLSSFHAKWKSDTLVMQKWFALQASRDSVSIGELESLEANEVYDKKVPNLLRSLVGAFAGNRVRFNDISGEGYRYLADKIIEIDTYNPQVASRLAKSMNHLRKLDEKRKELLARELGRILTHNLSDDTYEVVSNNLKA